MMGKTLAKLDLALVGARSKIGAAKFLEISAAIGAACAIAVLYLGLFIFRSEKISFFSIFAFFLPGVIWYFHTLYLAQVRLRKIEDEVPDLLLLASSMPEGTGAEKVIGFMAKTSRGPLAQEFEIARQQIYSGMPVHQALLLMKRRNNSRPLGRALDLIISSLNTGASMGSLFRETAEDFMETNSILRERGASMTVEKYTLLLAGGIIVPLVLGLICGMVGGMDFSAISELGVGMGEKQRAELVGASMLANIIYISEYALLASAFVAFQEGNQRKAVVYAIVLLPLGLLVYFAGKGF